MGSVFFAPMLDNRCAHTCMYVCMSKYVSFFAQKIRHGAASDIHRKVFHTYVL